MKTAKRRMLKIANQMVELISRSSCQAAAFTLGPVGRAAVFTPRAKPIGPHLLRCLTLAMGRLARIFHEERQRGW